MKEEYKGPYHLYSYSLPITYYQFAMDAKAEIVEEIPEPLQNYFIVHYFARSVERGQGTKSQLEAFEDKEDPETQILGIKEQLQENMPNVLDFSNIIKSLRRNWRHHGWRIESSPRLYFLKTLELSRKAELNECLDAISKENNLVSYKGFLGLAADKLHQDLEGKMGVKLMMKCYSEGNFGFLSEVVQVLDNQFKPSPVYVNKNHHIKEWLKWLSGAETAGLDEKSIILFRRVSRGGELLFTSQTNIMRIRPLVGIDICLVATGCDSQHCVVVDVHGRCYTWGMNERGQLGHGDMLDRDLPTLINSLTKYKIVQAGAGRSHTVVVTNKGKSFAFGCNKHGQLGSNSLANEFESYPVFSKVPRVTDVKCGGKFTVWLSNGAQLLLSAGLPKYGQLGHGVNNEYKDCVGKLAYTPQPLPKEINSFCAAKSVVKFACGTNHTVALDCNGQLYTWGRGKYGRLGHGDSKDAWVPQCVQMFEGSNALPLNAVISAGDVSSACTTADGKLYMWGKRKKGDYVKTPHCVIESSEWKVRCMDSGSIFHLVGTNKVQSKTSASCYSWGHVKHGESAFYPTSENYLAEPEEVQILKGMNVIRVGCGADHAMVVVDRNRIGERLDQFSVYEGKASVND